MLKNNVINLKVVEKVARALEEIKEEVVFIGGAVVSLYATDTGAEEARPTTDIDISVQVSTYSGMDKLRERLASKQFFPARGETVMYRYTYENVLIDFIPCEATSLGPTNSWLKPGFEQAIIYSLDEINVRILSTCYFLATKWEAYQNRGGDPRWSHDLEDIVYVLDNNLNIVNEVIDADEKVRNYLISSFKNFRDNPDLDEILECYINPYTANERKILIIEKLDEIISVPR